MRTYKEKDKRCEEILEMLDFYYDADHPIESLVSTEKIDELITILREEYGIFYAPKETNTILNTMEKYRMDICKAIGVEKVWCWSTTIDEVKSIKAKYDNLVKNSKELKDTNVTICWQESSNKDKILDLLFEELKNLEKDSKEDRRWGTNVWLKSIIKKEEESNGAIHNSIDIYVYKKLKDITESYRYTVRRSCSGSLYIVSYNPFQKSYNFDIQDTLDYIKDRCKEAYEELKKPE